MSKWRWRILSSVMKSENIKNIFKIFFLSHKENFYKLFSSSHARVMFNNSSFTFHYQAQNSPSSFTYHYSRWIRKCWSKQYAGRLSHMNSVKWPCCPWVLVAQWIERPPCVRGIISSILVGDSDNFFAQARVMLNNSSFDIRYVFLLWN